MRKRGHPLSTFWKEFVLLAALLLLTQWLGFRWGGLIATAAAVIGVTHYLNYRSLAHRVDNFSGEPGLPLSEFKRHYFDPRHNEVLVERPWRLVVYVFGYVMPRTIIAWSVLVVIHNALVYTDVEFYRPVRVAKLSLWLYLALPLIAVAFTRVLQGIDYHRYLR